MPRPPTWILLVVLSACEGAIIGGTGVATAASGAPAGVEAAACSPGGVESLVSARVRRLLPTEYQASLAAVGATAPVAGLFPKDPTPNGYANRADQLRMSGPLVNALWDSAGTTATQAAAQLVASSRCGTTDACARSLLADAAATLYRRPPSPTELDELMAVYALGAAQASFEAGLELALEVEVQAADALFHTELGDGADSASVVQLTPYEVADELAALTTGGPPDDALRLAAASGPLSADVREAQARRLLASAPARSVVGTFAVGWLEVAKVPTLERDATAFPQWPAIRQSALDETERFVADAVLEQGADLATLFTADWSVADRTMADYYGANPPDATGRIALGGTRRGVLTHASVLAAHAQLLDDSPVQRGHLVRMRLLCQAKTLAPPKELKISLPPPAATQTTRQRFAGHSSDPSCSGCHQLMDPIGFGFEHFDATGRYRTTDNGQPVDATGVLTGSDVDLTFDGVTPLAEALGRSQTARDCFSQHWFEYAFSQPVDDLGAGGLCRLRSAAHAFDLGGRPVRELIVDLVRSDLFVARKGTP